MNDPVLTVHGPRLARLPLVMDSPHSGFAMPDDFGAARTAAELREGEDCFIDALYAPACVARGVPLLAALFPRTYLDTNRHAADIDPELLAEPWPGEVVASGKARIGKALVWRTLDDGRPIYDRKLTVAEVQQRIARCHAPYHATLKTLLDTAHAKFGVVRHINCHSMNAVSGVNGVEGEGGALRPDIVLGDRDGTSCEPAFTACVREHFASCGYDVKVNDPFKGVELVRAFADPAAGRHSLQIEINKRLYMHGTAGDRHAGFARLQAEVGGLIDRIAERFPA